MNKNYIILITTVSLLFTNSCYQSNHIITNQNQHILSNQNYDTIQKQILNNREHPIKMGYGYDSRTGMSVGLSCLNNFAQANSLEINNKRANIHLNNITDTEVIANMLNTNIIGKANFGLYSSSLAANFVRSIINTRYSLHFNYWQSMIADIIYKNNAIGNQSLNNEAKYLLENVGIEEFTNICGDSFINLAQLGAVLFVDFAVHFNSAQTKTDFETKISGKAIGLANIEALFHNMDANIVNHITVDVQAMQLGGDITKFTEILGGKDQTSQNYHVTSCSNQNMQDCYKMINDIISYAKTYLDKSVDFNNINTLYTFDFSEKKYSSLGIKASLSDLSPQEQEAKDYIAKSITDNRKMLEYLQNYQQQQIITLLDLDIKQQLNKTIEKYKEMIKSYDNYQIIDACYGDTINIEKKCILVAKQIENLNNIYKEYIDFANNLSSVILIKNKQYDIYGHETGLIYWFLIPVGKNICDKLGQECQGIYALYKLNNKGLIEYTDNRCYVDTTQTNELGKKNHILNNKIFACEWFNGTAFVWNKYLKRVKIPPQIENQTKYATMGYFAYDNKGFLTETDEKIGINEYFNSFTFSSIAPEFTYNPI